MPFFEADIRIVWSPDEQSRTTAPSKVQSATGQFDQSGGLLLDRLSCAHLELLTAIDDPLKRSFYKIECIPGKLSVRQLKRQFAPFYFERSGLFEDKEKLSAMFKAGAKIAEPKLAIRDLYVI